MNKKQAIAYAQITLDYMQSYRYQGEINPDTFALEMKQSMRAYSKDIVLSIAEAQRDARNKNIDS